jgi:hypothetical protein
MERRHSAPECRRQSEQRLARFRRRPHSDVLLPRHVLRHGRELRTHAARRLSVHFRIRATSEQRPAARIRAGDSACKRRHPDHLLCIAFPNVFRRGRSRRRPPGRSGIDRQRLRLRRVRRAAALWPDPKHQRSIRHRLDSMGRTAPGREARLRRSAVHLHSRRGLCGRLRRRQHRQPRLRGDGDRHRLRGQPCVRAGAEFWQKA